MIAATLNSAAPDWSVIDETIRCPLCEYELRGLSEPRCPECGFQFDWPDVLDPSRRLHPYLFEHYPRRNIWSFLRTKLGGFAPWRFWQTLQPMMPSRPRRLVLYWLVHLPVLLLLLMGVFIRYYVNAAPNYQRIRTMVIKSVQATPNEPWTQRWIQRHGSLQKALDTEYPDPYSFSGFFSVAKQSWTSGASPTMPSYAPPTTLLLLWPWLTFGTLMIFRASMARAKVRTIHVLRCVIYSSDAMLVAVALLLPIVPQFTPFNYDPIRTFRAILIACSILSALTLYKLGFAYRLYLRFPHAWTTAIVSQLVVSLAIVTIGAVVLFWWR